MSHIVHSLEQAVEAGVKGIIDIAEGYMGAGGGSSASTPGVDAPEGDSGSRKPEALASLAVDSIPISPVAHTTDSSSPTSPPNQTMTPASSTAPTTSLAARLALVQDQLVQLTDVQSGWIYLQSTYLDSAGGQRRVRSFGLKNVSTTQVDVEIGSDLDSQVVFWVNDDGASDALESSSVSSISSLSSSAGSSVIALSIPVGATVTICLAFQPSPSTSHPSTPAGASTPSSEGAGTPRVLPVASTSDLPPGLASSRLPITAAAANGTGSILSDGGSVSTMSTSGLSVSTRDGGATGASGQRRSDPIHRSFSVHGSIIVHANAARDLTPDGLSPDALAAVPQAHQNVSLPFFATVCRSFFSAAAIDPSTSLVSGPQLGSGQLTIDFGTDNIVGNEVHRDILLVNRSEIDLVWTTAIVNSPFKDSVWFSLRDLDSENVFGVDTSAEPVPLPALSSRHLRLALHTTAPVNDFEFEFVISNAHQSGNVVTCKAVGSCQATAQDDSLRIQSGSALDYGQIADGLWAKKLITIKNAGDRPIDVHFSATPGYEVVFRLAGVAGEDIDDEDIARIRPLRDKRTEALSRTSTRDTRDALSVRNWDGSNGSFNSGTVASTSGRSQLLIDHQSVSSMAVDTDPMSALTLSDREGSIPPSRPLSRVTSHESGYRPSRNEVDSDDDENSPPLFATPAEVVPANRADNLGDRDIPNQIEELTMRPGTEYRIFALYRPAQDLANPPEIAGALRQSSFKVFFDSAPSSRSRGHRSRKVVHCTAESCTSIISIPSGNLIDFGEVTVGACKTTTIQIENLSALSARVEIAAISKVLMTNRNVIVIPPFETVHERIDFFPRRINDKYEKQVFVRNLLNRANNQLIEVHAKNVDVYNVTLHSHLYRILTPTGSNFVDFGSVVINSPSVRTVIFQNLSHKMLTLDLAASQPEDVELYIKRIDAPTSHAKAIAAQYEMQADGDRPGNGNLKERFVESLQDQGSNETKAPTKSKGRDKTVAKEKMKDGDKASLGASLVSAMKKGGRGRPVHIYGNAVVFKDRSLLDDHDYLDLACGPPGLAFQGTLPHSKRAHVLENIALEDKSLLSGQHPRVPKLDFAGLAKSSGLVSKDVKVKRSKSAAATKRDPATPTKQHPRAVSGGTPTSPTVTPIKPPLLKTSTLSSAVTKSPALTAKRLELKTDPATAGDVTKLTPEELILALEQHDARRNLSSVTHFTPEEEEQYVRRLLALRKELQSIISTGKIVPARVLQVPPGSSRQVIVVMTPNGSTRPHITTRAKRAESRIYIKVVEYDHSLLSTIGHARSMSELPVRDLAIRSSCVRSVLEVQQSSINFGTCERGEPKSRTIVLHNKSDCAGVYRMRTSGSIASGNLKLGLGRYGVVSAFGRKEVTSFSFTPSLVGNFQETIVVENVLDSYNDQNVLVKATVRKMPAFTLDATKIDFAPAQQDAWPTSSSFVLTNTSKADRTFVIEAAEATPTTAFAELSLSRDEKDAGVALSKGEEEEVEAMLQKLKIARRKNKADKIAKYEKRLAELGIVTAPADDAASTDAETEAAKSGLNTPAASELPTVPSLTFTLQANKKAKIIVNLVPSGHGGDAFTSSIKVFERKNTDETVTIDVAASPKPVEPAPANTASSDQDPLNLAIMRHCLDLTLHCPVSPTAFCVGSTLFLPVSSPLFVPLEPHFPTFPDPTTGGPAGLLLADGYSRQIPGNTHAEANALANFRDRMVALEDEAPAGLPKTADILAQASCFATMEPCSVRTSGGPSCALELVRAKVKAVLLGVEEPPDFVQCEGVRILEQGGVEVRRVIGLEDECLRLARRGRT